MKNKYINKGSNELELFIKEVTSGEAKDLKVYENNRDYREDKKRVSLCCFCGARCY